MKLRNIKIKYKIIRLKYKIKNLFLFKEIILFIQIRNTFDRNIESNSLKILEDDATFRLIV